MIRFQGVPAQAAVIVDLEAHDYEEDDHMSLGSFYWTVVSKKKHTSFGNVGILFFFMLYQVCGVDLKSNLRDQQGKHNFFNFFIDFRPFLAPVGP